MQKYIAESIVVKEAYRVAPSSSSSPSPILVNFYARWADSSLEVTGDGVWERRADLRGHKFRFRINF